MNEVLTHIEELRKQRLWTVNQLAEKSGVSQSTLANMLSRNTYPSIITLSQLCNAFGITLSQFFEVQQEDDNLTLDERALITNYRALPYEKQQALLLLMTKN